MSRRICNKEDKEHKKHRDNLWAITVWLNKTYTCDICWDDFKY